MAILAYSMTSGIAMAQSETLLLESSIPVEFDRGRNVSVVDRPRPDYDPLGINISSFNVVPQVQAGVGYSDNLYLTDAGQEGDGYFLLNPSVRVVSNWSRHSLQFRASGGFRRYFEQSLRNESTYSIGSLGRYEIGSDFVMTGEAQLARQFESPLTGEIESNVSALSRYNRSMMAVRGEYRSGQIRAVLAADRSTFDFNTITFPDGSKDSQADRNRAINRLTGQVQYAFTPSAGIYGQVSAAETNYDTTLFNGNANRDSSGIRVIGGVNLDLAGFLRGVIGAGYLWRKYDSPLYRDVSGFSAEAKLEYFFSPLTTFTLAGRRVIEDSAVSATDAYFDTRASLRVDHELLRNLILNTQAEFGWQNYVGSLRKSNVYRISGGGRYLSSNSLALDLALSYAGRNSNNVGFSREYNEFRAQFSIIYQR